MVYPFDGVIEADSPRDAAFRDVLQPRHLPPGLTAVTRHSTPWMTGASLPAFDDDVWELYDPGDWKPGERPCGGDA